MRTLLAAAALWAAFLMPAQAQDRPGIYSVPFVGSCAAYPEIVAGLGKRNLRLIERGISRSGHAFEIFADATGNWMFVYHFTDGSACTLDGGGGWERLPIRRGVAA